MFSNKIQATALRVSTGKIMNGDSVTEISNVLSINIPVLSTPQSMWAKKVDEIETPFADIYDEEEYRQNAALTLMGFFEMRIMLRGFGVLSTSQTDYAGKPLNDKKFFVAGCGPGREVLNLAALGGDVIGIDATKRYAEITAQKISRTERVLNKSLKATLYQCPVESYPYESGQFDGITSLFGVINHVQDWRSAMRKMKDSLKPGGRIVIEKYGSNEALVFRLSRNGTLPYQPSILQKRDPKGRGILLGESDEVLPAHFPSNREFTDMFTFDQWGFEIKKRIGFLRIAALFPKEATSKNISSFLDVVKKIDVKAWKFITKFQSPEELLFAAFQYDLISQKRKWWKDPTNIEDYAYVIYVAEKTFLPKRNYYSI